MKENLQPSCVTDPTFCQKQYAEQGGKLPCLLSTTGQCRVVNAHAQRLEAGVHPKISEADMKVDSHTICPMSTAHYSNGDPDEEVLHDHFNYLIRKRS